jgi:hypothetical protein
MYTDVVPFLKASLWRCSVLSRSPGENTRSPDRVAAAHLRRHLLEDATLEFSRCATLRCLGGGGLPRSALLGKASFVFCTHGVSRSARHWCPWLAVSFVGRFLVVPGLWWRLRRWCYLVGCGGCRLACATVSTGPTTYPALRLPFLFIECNSRAGCSRCRRVLPRMNLVLCVCAVLPCKLGSASCICLAIKGVINLTSGLLAFYLKKMLEQHFQTLKHLKSH